MVPCEWFAMCNMETDTAVWHPVFKDEVPICWRCAKVCDIPADKLVKLVLVAQ